MIFWQNKKKETICQRKENSPKKVISAKKEKVGNKLDTNEFMPSYLLSIFEFKKK